MKTPKTANKISTPTPSVPLENGDYLCSGGELYCVEHVGPKWAVLEDCRSGTLIDMPIAHTATLRRVTPAPAGP